MIGHITTVTYRSRRADPLARDRDPRLASIATLVVLLLASAIAFPSGAAHAQEMYDHSEPAPKDVLKQSPETMKIFFSEGIELRTVRLFKSDKTELPLQWAKTDEDVFEVDVRVPETLPPGEYELQWFAWVRQHYHSDGGVIPFTVAP